MFFIYYFNNIPTTSPSLIRLHVLQLAHFNLNYARLKSSEIIVVSKFTNNIILPSQ